MTTREIVQLDNDVIAAWNEHNIDKFLEYCADDIVWKDVANPEPIHGKEGARQFMQGWMTAFPDLHSTTQNRIIGEDCIASEIQFEGTNTGELQMSPDGPPIPATGKKVSNKSCYFARVRDGKVIEVNYYPDLAGMMTQLGLIPAPKTSTASND